MDRFYWNYKTEKISFALLIVGLIAFYLYKIYFLSIPYCWDESWVYGPAVSEMSTRLPSLLPGSIDKDLSRGHPLFFHFLGGIWGNIFGVSVVSLHVFSLAISSVLLYFTHKIIKEISSSFAANLAIVLLICQGLFLEQSAMVLPEVLVALLALLSIYHWSKEDYFYGALFASLCLLTKESGVILFPALGLSFLIHKGLRRDNNWKNYIRPIVYLLAATLPYVAFLLYQQKIFGWMFYPNHLDLQIGSAIDFQGKVKGMIPLVSINGYRIVLTVFTIVSLAWHFRKSKKFWIATLFVLLNTLVIYYTKWETWTIVISYILISFVLLLVVLRFIVKAYKQKHYFYLSLILFLFIYIFFSAYNFFTFRYFVVVLVLFVILVAKAFSYWDQKWIPFLLVLVLSPFCLTKGLSSQDFIEYGKAQLSLVRYMEEEGLYDVKYYAPFLVRESLVKKYAGYRSNNKKFVSSIYQFSPDVDFYNIYSSRTNEKLQKDKFINRELIFEKKFENGRAWFKIEHYSKATKE